ncbi:alpha/beta hydrolase [Haloflavibacter putidus]|uniref:Esterase n=1 Tax=Haloflavibacter putidus TaxID=2576776 RepID=A0A507ZBE2_9FLAO|nr:alpha/beta hydrolase-fold protein [Haloflavibacter putidus]TQD34021.1 esterase [Haloflavibacter putidus]
MRIKIGIILFGILGVFLTSCDSKKAPNLSQSEFFTDSIYSKHLKEYRKHNVYLPKGFEKVKKYPILYATDGSNKIENSFIKKSLDSLIENKIIEPIIYVGSHSNGKIADSTSTKTGNGKKVYLQYRNYEYVNHPFIESINPKLANRFKEHMQYFKEELITSVEQKFDQNVTKGSRYFYGVSNGAGFGLSMLNNHPNIIGTYFCFSTFGGDIQTNVWKPNVDYPKLFLEYGSDEPFFLKEDANFLKTKFNELNLVAEINEFNGGHDYKIWNEKFIEIISKELAVE